VFNLSAAPQRLAVQGDVTLAGPSAAADLGPGRLDLGPNGVAYLASAGTGFPRLTPLPAPT
jgi:hypothetical protein